MTQIVVTLENGADSTFLRKVIENMKGVLRTSVKDKINVDSHLSKRSEWLYELHKLKDSIDTSKIDMEDARTQYIMSK